MNRNATTFLLACVASVLCPLQGTSQAPATGTSAVAPREQSIRAAMKSAAQFYHDKIATQGGYVYYYTTDLQQRWGEGEATADQIWVQQPGTPAVGLAFLRAWAVTKDPYYLTAATDAARALVKGQLVSGGWTHSIDFAANGKNAARYRKMPGGPRDHSSLDDGVTQHALRLLMRVDQALEFRDAEIHEASEYAREALAKAQFPSGGFPQSWPRPEPTTPPTKASFPEYDWKTENRIKNYWELPTLNDDLAMQLGMTLEDGWTIYKDERFKAALARLGDFLILAQMPDPQRGWAQQYDHQMHPVWARKFEPPALAGRESQGAIRALLRIHRVTGDPKYLAPIAPALEYLRRSVLPDGKLARYYELKTNRPLYMTRDYALTYSDAEVPQHYGWKTDPKIEPLARQFAEQQAGKFRNSDKPKAAIPEKIDTIISTLDKQGRWISIRNDSPLVGQPKIKVGTPFISSEVFCDNMEALCTALQPPTE